MTEQTRSTQRDIIEALAVSPNIDADHEIERRVGFLADYLRDGGLKALVLGISGGVDSTIGGRLCQLAVERVRDNGGDARFYAVRLPHGEQHDADDARTALDFIQPDELLDVNIEAPTSGMQQALENSNLSFDDAEQEDFILGNVKARQRMVVQYAIASRHSGLVVGTDQAAEAVMGFFTKFGDGAADVTPLFGLTKGQVRALGEKLGAPDALVNKQPTADLESLKPQRPDEEVFGVSYDEIDRFLEGGEVSSEARETIIDAYEATAHKRAMPAAP
ncbi:NAD synthetase [Salinisphaera shabanensis T35B1]|jgi:NAD+ synthase|uniref:ammonia-dependent NAD(+) synthetase n=1 Tax=Salinisphaera shabanensis TaxID=180542 RepID=UPI003340127F